MRRDLELRHLLQEVIRTKAEHRHELGKRLDPSLILSTREASLRALEAYVAALEERHLPTPPTMHRDLKLLRLLCSEARTKRR
jgi:hypothetical protein